MNGQQNIQPNTGMPFPPNGKVPPVVKQGKLAKAGVSIPKVAVDTGPLVQLLLNFVVPLICMALIVLLGLTIIYPSYTSLAPLRTEVDTKDALKNQLELKVAKLKKLIDLKSAVKENSDLVDRVLVSESSAPMFLDEINQIARNAGFDVSRLASSKPKVPAGVKIATDTPELPYETITAALGAKANFEQVIIFLQELERAARVLEVNDIRFSNRGAEQGSSIGTLDISIAGPYLTVNSSAVTDDPIDFDITSKEFIELIDMLKSLKYYEFANTLVELPEEVTEEHGEEETGTGGGGGTIQEEIPVGELP